jgi:glyoxylase-like metal-dependent hydrolase (beta-lactamase superfamily II)
VRAIGLHGDVVVITSQVWQTTCVAVRSGDEGFVIDSPVLPEELEVLPAMLEQAQFPVSALLATHGDWDHLLGRSAFPELSLGVAESTATRLAREPGAAQRELRDFDDEWHIVRPRPLSIPTPQALPVPGKCGIGQHDLELHPAEGHTVDGMAIVVPWAQVLVVGDYLSPVEIPMISPGGSIDAYAATLERLEPLVSDARMVVPGHGAVQPRDQALAILEADRAYLEDLRQRGAEAELPEGRRSPSQQRVHAENVERLDG